MQAEQDKVNTVLQEYKDVMTASSKIVTEMPKGPNRKPLINKETVAITNHEKIIGEDRLGNMVVVPKGFKVAFHSGETVKEGIIIEDTAGNQFVWIPVSNIDHEGTGKIKVNNTNEEGVEITLGRYSFDGITGEETKAQYGSEYEATTLDTIKSGVAEKYKVHGYNYDHYELVNERISNGEGDLTGTNTTAKDLKGFIESVRDHHGYYLARYEASYGSGYNGTSSTPYANAKPLSQKSKTNSTSNQKNAMDYTTGTLWNYITQGDAATVSRNMYVENSTVGVESDLVNGYAWDTALIYIQAMGHTNYANECDELRTLRNTGSTGDEVCHIFDMAKNCYEYITEYCNGIIGETARPSTQRGGGYSASSNHAHGRYYGIATLCDRYYSFRVLIYLK